MSPEWVTATATGVLAFVGLVSIIVNSILVHATNQEAAATRREAEASASMLKEVQRDRELTVQPVLVYEHAPLTPDAPSRERLAVRNIGKGPALLCYYVSDGLWQKGVHRTREVGTAGPFSLGSGQATEAENIAVPRGPIIVVEHQDSPNAAVDSARSGFRPADINNFLELLLCQDQFGNRYRFVRGEAEPEIVRADDPEPPEWTNFWRWQTSYLPQRVMVPRPSGNSEATEAGVTI
jgi:hypothetical protein